MHGGVLTMASMFVCYSYVELFGFSLIVAKCGEVSCELPQAESLKPIWEFSVMLMEHQDQHIYPCASYFPRLVAMTFYG